MWQEPRTLGMNNAIDIHNPPPNGGNGFARCSEHLGRVAPPIGRFGIREHLPHITECSSSEQGINHGMQQDIGIAMANQVAIMWNIDTPKSQRSSRPQTMRVVTHSHPHNTFPRFPG